MRNSPTVLPCLALFLKGVEMDFRMLGDVEKTGWTLIGCWWWTLGGRLVCGSRSVLFEVGKKIGSFEMIVG